MNILILLPDTLQAGGGIAQFNRDLVAAVKSGFSPIRVQILALRGVAGSGAVDIERSCGGSRLRMLLEAARLGISRKQFDLVICGHIHLMPVAILATVRSMRHIWLVVHGIEAWQPPRRYSRWCSRQATLVTAVSRITRTRFLHWSGVDPLRVRVLPNTVDPRFSPGDQPESLRQALRLQNRKVLLTVGRMDAGEQYKGHADVIRALPRVKASIPDVAYLIVGDGSDKPRLVALAETCGVANDVRFVSGVDPAALGDYYRLADVFIMPSRGEGFGIVYLEAIASGIPAIGSGLDGSRDALGDGRFGQLADPDALDHAIIQAIEASRTAHAAESCRLGTLTFSRENFNGLVRRLLPRAMATIPA